MMIKKLYRSWGDKVFGIFQQSDKCEEIIKLSEVDKRGDDPYRQGNEHKVSLNNNTQCAFRADKKVYEVHFLL